MNGNNLTVSTFLCLAAGLGASSLSLALPVAELPEPPAGAALVYVGTPPEMAADTVVAEGAAAPTKETLFEIGSITKVFTGLILAKAVTDGDLELSTKLSELLPQVEFSDERVGEITLLQLATHTSGLPRLPDNFPDGTSQADPYAGYDRERLLSFLAGHTLKETDAEDGYAADYSNLGMGLLGFVVAGHYNRTFEEHVAATILQPLGMKDTGISLTAEERERLATPYNGTEEASLWEFDVLAGAGALRSTASDLAVFAEALLAPDETPLAEPIRLALEPRTDFAGSKIGLGILRGEIHGKERIYHDGGTGGFTSSLVLTPETNGVQIVLANQANNYASQLATLLLQPEDGKSAMAEIVAKRDENPVPERPWTAYEGRYELNPQATFLVKEVDGRLYARLTGQVALPLEYAGNDTFVNESVGAWIAFVFEGEEDRKQANSLILNQAGRRMPAPLKKAAVETSLLLPEGVAQQYEGTYQLAPGADIKVTAKDRQLIVQLTGQQAIPVLPDGKDAFAYDVVEARIVFNRDEEGEVKSLTLFQNGREMKAPRKQS